MKLNLEESEEWRPRIKIPGSSFYPEENLLNGNVNPLLRIETSRTCSP